MIKLKIIT